VLLIDIKVPLMILLEQYIELKIYHFDELRKYNVVELFSDCEGVSFKIFNNAECIFTLIPTMKDSLTFELSDFDKENKTCIDWKLYSKIKASLFSIFLKGPSS